jgi:hypothetical protein
MGRSKLWIPALAMGCLVGALVHADEVTTPAPDTADAQASAEAPAMPTDAVADPAAAPVDPASAEPSADATSEAEAVADSPAALAPDEADAAAAEAESTEPALGAIGYDSQGRQGRIHIVSRGDTLWDISDAYLGTPWVWPSIWRDNGQVENPHRIFPGDRIWITPNEMRKITAEEAAQLLANRPPGEELIPAAAEEPGLALEQPPAAPSPVPAEAHTLKVSSRETTGLITAEQYEASASIVGRVPERLLMSQEDRVYIGSGEGQVAVGDQLTIFHTNEKVYDPDTGRLLGYHVEFIGHVEVTETHPETSTARIAMSTGEVEMGDRLTPREPVPAEITLQPSPQDVDGKISFFPQQRVVIGWNDFVYLNRGTTDGLEVGSPLEVYRPGYKANEPARDETVQVPDQIVGRLVVVRAADSASVAIITKSSTELRLGDRFRGAGSEAGAPSETN